MNKGGRQRPKVKDPRIRLRPIRWEFPCPVCGTGYSDESGAIGCMAKCEERIRSEIGLCVGDTFRTRFANSSPISTLLHISGVNRSGRLGYHIHVHNTTRGSPERRMTSTSLLQHGKEVQDPGDRALLFEVVSELPEGLSTASFVWKDEEIVSAHLNGVLKLTQDGFVWLVILDDTEIHWRSESWLSALMQAQNPLFRLGQIVQSGELLQQFQVREVLSVKDFRTGELVYAVSLVGSEGTRVFLETDLQSVEE